jgi:hypothetical protein
MTLAKQEELQQGLWAKITGGVGIVILIIGFILDSWLLWVIAGVCIFYAIMKWPKLWNE